MTAIKRSFYYALVIIMAIVFLLPVFKTNAVSKKHTTNVADISELAASILISNSNLMSSHHNDKFSSIYSLHNANSYAQALSPLALTAENAMGAIPLSTTFNIATTSSEPVIITDAEKTMIAATVQLEVVGKYSNIYQFENSDLKYYEMLAVAQIIKNRLKNEMFPDTVNEVIHFISYNNGNKVYQFATSPDVPYTTPTQEALDAVSEVFDNGINVLPEDYVYFCATWRESAFEQNNRTVLRYVGNIEEFDKIIADATTFYAGVTIKDNMAHGYVY